MLDQWQSKNMALGTVLKLLAHVFMCETQTLLDNFEKKLK